MTLSGTLKGKKISYKLKYSLAGEPTELAPVHRLAAKAKIKELEVDEGKYCQYKLVIVEDYKMCCHASQDLASNLGLSHLKG